MFWLLTQTLFWLFLALLFGILMGWLLRGLLCGECRRSDDVVAKPTEAKAPEENHGPVITDNMRPAAMAEPLGMADDLKRIRGVGPVIEKTLNGLGIFHFRQIAEFSQDNVAWVNNYIAFPGRVEREQWVSQAKDLATGQTTEFSQRYDRGEVGENNPNRKD